MRDSRSRPRWLLAAVGLGLMLLGLLLASRTQTAGGVTVEDVRFPGAKGVTMSGLLYRPASATARTPAPAVLAVHGYINTRETQDAFAIELARRGYVVLAMDQRGHGYSGGGATKQGFGGPDGLAYLRRLPIVDKGRIGLEGHSMGGWTVLAAAKAMPEAYQAMVLEGSSTGAPFSAPGTPVWPRNVAVVFSQLDEFGPLMWGVDKSRNVARSAKLKALFGTDQPVTPGLIYGDKAAGTARVLQTPYTTHPGDHFSTAAVGHAVAWFDQTIGPQHGRSPSDQIWMWKEAGTLIALIGVFVLLLGLIDVLLSTRPFAALNAAPDAGAPAPAAGASWWALLLAGAFIPAVSFILLPLSGRGFLPLSAVWPQSITNQLAAWAMFNTVVAVVVGLLFARRTPVRAGSPALAAGLAVAVMAGVYLAAWAGSRLFLADYRLWVVALKPLSKAQAIAALAYLPFFAVFLTVAYRGLAALVGRARTAAGQYAVAVAALALGFAVVVGAIYLVLFATGALPKIAPALNSIVAIQFVPLLAFLGVVFTFVWRRTGTYLPAALTSALFVTWYMVAGTATQFGP